jgi:hypothetical protein
MTKANLSRRLFVGALGGSVIAAPVVALRSPLADAGPRLLRPLGPGSRLARWTVAAIEPPERGAIGLCLHPEGEPDRVFRLEILARDRGALASRPPGETEHFAVFVQNGGDGLSPTAEEQGLAAMTVAAVIRQNEAPGDVDGFLTHAERIAHHRDSLMPERA